MTVINDLDRYHLAMDVINRCNLGAEAKAVLDEFRKKLREHGEYIREHGEDMPEIRDWRWEAPVLT